ncbi:MAG: SMP-30/gluconolactonase/LRE family protein [Hyphomonadaceae bacterium]|nr:SMP-30/gluconolactonase/LRE family protein [Hyphomonadaceae bacterium]
MDARCVWPARAQLGEGPLWDPRDGLIYFVDIKGRMLNRCDLAGAAREAWPMPEPICWVIPRARAPGFIAGFKSGIAELTLDPFAITPLHAPEPDRRTNRLNDAKCDSRGRIWAGSMDDEEKIKSGALYRFDPDRTCTRVDDAYGVANGPAFSADGAVLYHTDSAARTIYAFDIDAAGALANKRPFIRFEDRDWGYPDGMTVDAEGGLWVAHWEGARVSRFRPDGSLDRIIALPVSRVTSCVFAGPALDRMFVTTAAIGREHEELAGALFELFPGVRGLPAHSFAG